MFTDRMELPTKQAVLILIVIRGEKRTEMEAKIRSWIADHKAALVLEIIQGNAKVAEVSRYFNLSTLGV
jgi:hypothetical protein